MPPISRLKAALALASKNQEYERWKKIPGWPSYSASTLGRIRRDLPMRNPRLKVGILNTRNYAGDSSRVSLTENNKRLPCAKVHLLVLMTFIGRRPSGLTETRHLNDTPSDNRLSNLKYGTPSENYLDRIRNGIQNGFTTQDAISKRRSNLKAIATKRRMGIPLNGRRSRSTNSLAGIKSAATKHRLGIAFGLGALSAKERTKAVKLAWVTRRKLYGSSGVGRSTRTS